MVSMDKCIGYVAIWWSRGPRLREVRAAPRKRSIATTVGVGTASARQQSFQLQPPLPLPLAEFTRTLMADFAQGLDPSKLILVEIVRLQLVYGFR
jgi:hypothetical protein